MGINFSHGDAHWAYSGFNRFREKLAAEIGITLEDMEGFQSYSAHLKGEQAKNISWDTVTDPIKPLLNHSDCDGELTPEECRAIYPRLRELVANWDDNDYDKHQALELADGMVFAATENKPLVFR